MPSQQRLPLSLHPSYRCHLSNQSNHFQVLAPRIICWTRLLRLSVSSPFYSPLFFRRMLLFSFKLPTFYVVLHPLYAFVYICMKSDCKECFFFYFEDKIPMGIIRVSQIHERTTTKFTIVSQHFVIFKLLFTSSSDEQFLYWSYCDSACLRACSEFHDLCAVGFTAILEFLGSPLRKVVECCHIYFRTRLFWISSSFPNHFKKKSLTILYDR